MKLQKIKATVVITATMVALTMASGCRDHEDGVPHDVTAATNAVAPVPPAPPAPPTPAQRCSAKATYNAVVEAVNGALIGKPTLTRPLNANDFSRPMVEDVNRDAMAIDCSARLHVPAPPHHPSCAAANYAFLDRGEMEGAGFSFRVQYRLHDAADGSGTTIELPQSEHINYAMTDCSDR